MKELKVNIIGLGYIGLPTAAILADNSYEVFGTDINQNVVNTINDGNIHITEPDLFELVNKSVKSGKLSACTKPKPSDIYIICVPTPLKKIDEQLVPQLSYVDAATRSLKTLLKPNDLVILESTSPVGTTKFISEVLEEEGVDISKISFAYCPERVLPGSIIKELTTNDRVVGGLNNESTEIAASFYKTFVKGNVYKTNAETAEMCKLTENSFRDVNIAFANELSIICDDEDINVNELIMLANKHPRVDILEPGPGVGGHCIAIDPWFIVSKHKSKAKLIESAREVNINKEDWVLEKIQESIDYFKNKHDKEPICACYGVSYKPNIEDCRESPALNITKNLSFKNKNVIAVDPYVTSYDGILIKDLEYAVVNADIHIFLVKHDDFKEIDFSNMKQNFELLDYCKILN